jgi:two-component system cell cycle sensor histidine kinase/response regulator CckA
MSIVAWLKGLPRRHPAAAVGPPAPCTETILVVDDEEGLRRFAARVLQRSGYKVLTAGSGEEALPVLERHDGPVHLVLTDMVMPGMGGRNLAEQLAKIRPEIRVLFTSGATDDAALQRGFDRFVGKPYMASQLTRSVRDVLDSQDMGQPRRGR